VCSSDLKLKLVAGDVNRVPPEQAEMGRARRMMMAAMDAEPSFAEKSFFEYHLYTLQRPTTLADNETKQIELVTASDAPVQKRFIYDPNGGTSFGGWVQTEPSFGETAEKKVFVMLEFKNTKENRLGIPLPKGRVRVYKQDTDGSLEFVGEDRIDHTPKDETVRVKMGNAFDIVGERTRQNINSGLRTLTETFQVKLRNHKEESVTVRVVERLNRWSGWKIVDASAKWTKKDAHTIEFDVPVAKDGESTVSYTVKYAW
jgi:hypothetical protein